MEACSGADGVAGWNFSGSCNGKVRRLSTCAEEDVPELWTAIGKENKIYLVISVLLFAVPAAGRIIFPGCGGICAIDPVAGATPSPLIPGLIDAIDDVENSYVGETQIIRYDVSPDGSTLAFIALGFSAVGSTDIWTVNLDGTNLQRMVRQERYELVRDAHVWWDLALPAFFGVSWAPDGTEIAYLDAYSGIFFMTPGGTPPDQPPSDRERAFIHGVPSGEFHDGFGSWSLDWSSDGRIFFVSGRSVSSVNRDGTEIRSLHRGVSPSVSPDGKRVSFIAGYDSLYAMGSDGVDPAYVAQGCCPAWSPDSRSIAYFSEGFVRIVEVEGGNQLDLYQTDYVHDKYGEYYSADLDWIESDKETGVFPASWGEVKSWSIPRVPIADPSIR